MKRHLSNNRKVNLTEGSIVKNIWVLAFPLMIGSILQVAFNLVDMIWVGRLGAQAIAGVAMAGAVLMVIMTFVMGVSTGTQSLIARFTGSQNRESAENVAMQSLIIGAVLSIVMAITGLVFARPILQLLGAPGAILHNGIEYLQILLTGGLLMIYLFLANAIFRASGDAYTPMLIMIGATVLNAVLDPLMIFGIGFPPMGVAGAALATVFSWGLAALVGLFILFQGYSRVQVHLAKLRLDIHTIFRIIKIGFPNSVQMALRSIAGLILMAIVARYGKYAIAAYGIGLRVFSIILMPSFALAATAATLVGQNLGARKFLRAEKSAWSAAGFGSAILGALGILFFIFSTNLISIFNADPEIVKLGSDYLKITSFGYIFVAQGVVLGRSLMGAGDTVSPLLIAIFALLGFQIPLAFILPSHFHIGIEGVWWAILISSVLQGILTRFWFNRGYWKLKKI